MQVHTQFNADLEMLWGSAFAKEHIQLPFFTFAWHQSWYKHLGHDEKPAIYTIPELGIVVPLSIQKTTAHFTGGEEIADYLDIIGASEHKEQAWKQIVSLLSLQGATELLLRNIPEDSPTLMFFKKIRQAVIKEEDKIPILTLPETYEQYLLQLGRKERHELRRKTKRFEEFAPQVSFTIPDTTDIATLLQLMRKQEEKKDFLTNDVANFFHDLPVIAPDTLCQFTLTDNTRPVATTLSFNLDQSLLLYNSGYDLEGSGWYLKTKIIQWAIKNKLKTINFLQGGERYKYDLGAVDSFVYRVTLSL